MSLRSPRGFHDIKGSELKKFRKITGVSREILKAYNYEEIITPVVEFAQLFERSVGEATDIVQKEMFLFQDRGGRKLALRPEGTAGVVRAYIQGRLYLEKPYHKLFYEGPMFRYERPQAGRYRQFHQIGVEVFGVRESFADAELLKLADDILRALDIEAVVEINSLGCKECRPAYVSALTEYLESVKDELCDVCLTRRERNPMRVLDCKVETCKVATMEAPSTVDFLCEECKSHYKSLKDYINALGIRYRENPRLVRGLDYYTRTVFEIIPKDLENAVVAGGRYDYLVEELGGPPTPALGFAVGVERLALLLREPEDREELYFIAFFGNVHAYALKVADLLRRKGKKVELSFRGGGLRKQLELANRMGASFAVIIGEDELREGKITLKDMRTGVQRRLSLAEL